MELKAEPRVSLITPCWNGEKHLWYFLDSLLEQTYTNVEFFFINDGSTDRTEEVFKSYEDRLKAKGWDVFYIYQENKGQAAALNQGLKRFTGDYLIWPDSDDILYPNHIEEKVKFMEENLQYGLAYCILDIVYEDDLSKVLYQYKRDKTQNLFNKLICNNGVLWEPIGTIARASAFLETVPTREIFESQAGQNCQLQLPIAYKYPCGFINKALGKYVKRESSHSTLASKRKIAKMKLSLEVWFHTLDRMNCIPKHQLLLYKLQFIFANIIKEILSCIFGIKNEYKLAKKYRKILILFGGKFELKKYS